MLSPPVFDELLHPHWHHFCVLDSNPSERQWWLHWLPLASFGCCGGKMRNSWLIAFRRSKLGDERSSVPCASGCCFSEWGYLWYLQLKGGEGVAVAFPRMWQLPLWPKAAIPPRWFRQIFDRNPISLIFSIFLLLDMLQATQWQS